MNSLVGVCLLKLSAFNVTDFFSVGTLTNIKSRSVLNGLSAVNIVVTMRLTSKMLRASTGQFVHFTLVSCPNECGACPVRQDLKHHISKECPLEVINCDFHYAGCEVQLPHKDMPAHLAENIEVHTAQLAAHTEKRMAEKDRQIVQLTEELEVHRWKIDRFEKENEALKESLQEKILRTQNDIRMSEGGLTWALENLKKEVLQLKAKQEENQSSLQAIRAHAGVVPVLTEFRKHKRHSKEWYSEPFYTHPHGYKMCLRVDANGAGGAKGKYVSVFGYIMRGRFDIHLIWPFRGVVMVTLVNQLQDKEHVCTLRTKLLSELLEPWPPVE